MLFLQKVLRLNGTVMTSLKVVQFEKWLCGLLRGEGVCPPSPKGGLVEGRVLVLKIYVLTVLAYLQPLFSIDTSLRLWPRGTHSGSLASLPQYPTSPLFKLHA